MSGIDEKDKLQRCGKNVCKCAHLFRILWTHMPVKKKEHHNQTPYLEIPQSYDVGVDSAKNCQDGNPTNALQRNKRCAEARPIH